LLLACDPASIYDLSLQLSFAAAWGLIALAPPIHARLLRPFEGLDRKPSESTTGTSSTWEAAKRKARDARFWSEAARAFAWWGARGACGVASLSIAAHVGTMPVLVFSFGSLSVASLLANLPIVPLSAMLVGAGVAALLLPLRPIFALSYALADSTARLVGSVASWRAWWLEGPPASLTWTIALVMLVGIAAVVAWWPNFLFTMRDDARPHASEHEAPRAPDSLERAMLWRSTIEAAREAAQVLGGARKGASEDKPSSGQANASTSSSPSEASPSTSSASPSTSTSGALDSYRRKPRPTASRRGGHVAFVLVLALGMFGAVALWRIGHGDDGKLRVSMLDVGQGECIVARWRGRTLIVDGGSSDRPEAGRGVLVPFLHLSGVRRVDALFVTHPTPTISTPSSTCCAKSPSRASTSRPRL
jgi:hypothetical protein